MQETLNDVCPLQASEDLLMQHYIDLKDRPFFLSLVNYMSSGPVVAMVRTQLVFFTEEEAGMLTVLTESLPFMFQVWEGKGVVKTGRVMLGETNPADSKPGTIRGDFCIDVSKWVPFGSVPSKLFVCTQLAKE